MVTVFALEKDGLRTLSASSSSAPSLLLAKASLSVFSSVGDNLSNGVGANEEVAFEVSDAYPGTRSLLFCASSAASESEMADGFFRVLN
jgi:hypothetical protein